jgi:hypothetical protein
VGAVSRRRYISTDISLDKRVNTLARDGGDFAVLLYTWMIPHAGDDATITGDPEELLYTVFPGRRDKTPEDIETALEDMTDLDLIARHDDMVYFDTESFYKYQSYIQEKNRRDESPAKSNSANQRKSAKNAGEQRKSAQNAASLSPSPSLSPPKALRARKISREPIPAYDLVPLTGPITRIIGRARIPEALDDASDLNHAIRRYLAATDALVDRNLGDLTPAKLEAARVKCRYQALDRIKSVPDNPAAYLTAAAGNATCLGDIVGDELVTELRQKRGKA